MSKVLPSLEEGRFLVSYGFLRMLLLLAGGALVNAFFLAFYGLTFRFGNLQSIADWRIVVTWIIVYPVLWSIVVTYSLPTKLRGSPIDLSIATTMLLLATYTFAGNPYAYTLGLTFITGLIIVVSSFLQTLLIDPIVGLGKAGGLPYYYDSFVLEGRKVSDFSKVYDSEQYRDWLLLPNAEITIEKNTLIPNRIILSSPKYENLIVFLFLSNHQKGLLAQIIAFEKGKYSIFKSKSAVFCGEQIKRILQWELDAPHPLPLVVEIEREAAEFRALRVTRSIVSLRGIRTRDKIVLAVGTGLLTLEYLLWASFGIITSSDSYATLSILTLFGVVAELSYRRLKGTDIWSRLTSQTQSSEREIDRKKG